MKKLLSLFSIIAALMIVVSSCNTKDPVVEKGELQSAIYNPTTKSFTLTYSSGQTETVNAVIDNSVNPPFASVKLNDGTIISVSDATKEGTATISTPTQVSNNKYLNDWIYEQMSIYYYWNTKIPKSPNYSLTPDKFFDSVLYKYSATDPDGDRFSWIQEDYTELLKSLSGVASDEIGFDYTFLWADQTKTHYYALVTYVKLGTDALAKGIKRGRFITKINGQNITAQNHRTLFGGTGTKTLSMADWKLNTTDQKYYLSNSPDVTISMHKDFAENPVYLDSVYTVGDKKIGYLTYNFFARDKGDNSHDYDKMLMAKLEGIKAKGATEMVLDLRYNSGGAVSSAIALASALVKNRSTSNVLVTSEYNSLVHTELQKEYGANYNKEYFIDKITKGTTTVVTVPSLNLNRLYVLTGNFTASASEFVINGLKPYMDVILVGETTYGKNVGSITIYEKNDPKNKWGMQPIIVKYLNSLGQSDFTTGFKPNHEIDEFEDLFLYQFGDTNDPLLGKAISLITGQTRLTRSTVSTSLRSSQIDEKKTLDMKNRSTFEMYDDVRGDDIRNLMKKK
ncbi:S41 family peptidase [Petrimonas sp.]|uniref:S41 family peptidase n=1 Tax=Petrimonas sp. TaxID=2023866 RepID=UPI003F5144D3